MKGRKRYIVEPLYNNLNQIQTDFSLPTNAAAQNKAVEYINLGREVEKVRDRFVLADIFFKKRKR